MPLLIESRKWQASSNISKYNHLLGILYRGDRLCFFPLAWQENTCNYDSVRTVISWGYQRPVTLVSLKKAALKDSLISSFYSAVWSSRLSKSRVMLASTLPSVSELDVLHQSRNNQVHFTGCKIRHNFRKFQGKIGKTDSLSKSFCIFVRWLGTSTYHILGEIKDLSWSPSIFDTSKLGYILEKHLQNKDSCTKMPQL